jgi:hypothetical protein
MANIIIVTRQCYLQAEAINHIAVHEVSESDKEDSLFYDPPPTINRRSKKKLTPKQKLLDKLKRAAQLYQITINFVPHAGNPQAGISKHSNGNDSVEIQVRGYDRAMGLYQDMLAQIREQLPDRLFLDRMVEKFFAENPVNSEDAK